MDDNIIIRSNRVFQLESHNLDNELNKTMDSYVENLQIPKVSEEIKLLLKLYISMNHLKQGTTIGMKTYNLKYYEAPNFKEADSVIAKISPRSYKLLVLTASNIILPYLTKRYDYLRDATSRSPLERLKFSWLTLENLTHLTKLIRILNFMVFLIDGRQLQIQERLLNIIPGLPSKDYYMNMTMNKIQMELLNRETVWRVLAEFLTNVIPFMNIEKVKNQFLRLTSLNQKSTYLKLSDQISTRQSIEKCGICDKQPFNPYVIGCKHVFCYYCLYSRYLIDKSEGFSCSHCNYKTMDQSQVARFRIFNIQNE